MANAAQEEYLRAFYYLQQKNGVARSSALAAYLGISKAGVSGMLRKLSSRGLLVVSPYSPARLTRRGMLLARKMTFKHRVLELFLSNKLGMEASAVHEEASRLEHAASDETVRRIYNMLGRPRQDPHGQPIVKVEA
jgi:DtxR family Mn-dependent transcriptional regulator